MSIEKEDGYFRSQELVEVPSIGIESNRINECIEEIKKNKIKGVFGSPFFGFNEENLSFLSKTPWVEFIWFWDVSLKDIEGLYSLTGLRSFGCHPKRPPIDFSKFEHLKKVMIEPKAKDRGLGDLRLLETLHIWRYKPKTKDFSLFEIPSSVTELQITWANPKRLDSLPSLPNLKRLVVERCRNLESLGDLHIKYPQLEHLVVGTCGKISKEESERVLSHLGHLKHAYIQGSLLHGKV